MQAASVKFRTIDQYITAFPPATQRLLQQMRETIRKAAPKAEETISYNMPGFRLDGVMLVWFAGYKNHIGFYPKPSGLDAFKAEISAYKSSKGAVQFPLDKPLPLKLVSAMVKFRIKENKEKA